MLNNKIIPEINVTVDINMVDNQSKIILIFKVEFVISKKGISIEMNVEFRSINIAINREAIEINIRALIIVEMQ